MNIYLEITALAMLCALNSALIGSWLVVNGMALMSDGMSHALILGIALTFCMIHSTTSWLLLIGAGISGWVLTLCVIWLMQRHNLSHDAALGLSFPCFFSLGTILITKYANTIHLDIDMVLLGDITYAPLKRLYCWGIDCGPTGMWYLSLLFMVSSGLIYLMYRYLLMASFDALYTKTQGISVSFIHALMLLITSIITVLCFDLVGSLTVISLMIVPAATALLHTSSMAQTIMMSMLYGSLSALIGCFWGVAYDVSIAGSISAATGFFFLLQTVYYLYRQKSYL